MKILMALTYYYPHWTGLTAYAKRIAEGLVSRGHQVTVVTAQFADDQPLEDEHAGVRIVRVPSWFRLSRGRVMPTFPRMVKQLMAEHDIVQVHTPMLETALVGRIAHRAGKKMVMTHHGDLLMPSGLFNQFVQLTVGRMLDDGAAAADVITTHSQDYAEHSAYLHPYLSKLEAIYPPAVLPDPDSEAVAFWRTELGLQGKPLVGFAGRFVEEKGFDYLLKAIPFVQEAFPDVRFAYAGECNVVYEGFYESCCPMLEAHKDAIAMLGLLTDQQKLANFYAMCDVFALPSRTDCFPSVQIESLLCGTPLVTTDIPGAREVLQVTGMGKLVEPRNERALAEGIIEVLRNRQAYIKSPETIRNVFSLERTIDAYETLFERLVN